jgi:hypothetical protein
MALNQDRGSKTRFAGEETYNIKQFQYPIDLHSNNGLYGGNYVIFYINVAEDSRILKKSKEDIVDPASVPARLRGDAADTGAGWAQTVGGGMIKGAVPGVVAGVAANGLKGGIRGVTKSALKGGVVGVAVGAAGAGVVAIAAGGKMARQQKRLKKAIALHVPNQLNIRYGMNYDAQDTAAQQLALTAASSQILSAAGAGAVTLALTKGPNAELLSAQSGLAPNPKKENLFKSVDFRTFQFDYMFFPRNAEEAANVRNIIKEFKVHMHPEYKDDNNFLFIYPSEFDVFYYNNGVENMNIHRHTSCVLTEMSVNYTPNAMFNTFDDGMPTQINVQLTFKELAILTKQQIEDGF